MTRSPIDQAQARDSFVPFETQLRTIGTACSCEFDAVRVVHTRLMLGAALNVAHLRSKDLVRAQVSYVEACVSCGTGSCPVILKSASTLHFVHTMRSLTFAQELTART